MDQNNKNQTQGQNKPQGGMGQNKQPESGERGDPSTTERMPNQGGGSERPDGENKQGSQQTKF